MCDLLTCTGCGKPLAAEDLAARGQAAAGRAAAVLAAIPDEWWWCAECAEAAFFLLSLDVARRASTRAGYLGRGLDADLDVPGIARGEAA